MSYKEQVVTKQRAESTLVEFSGDDLFNGILDGLKTSQCLNLADDADWVGYDSVSRVEKIGYLGAQTGINLPERLDSAFNLASDERESKDD